MFVAYNTKPTPQTPVEMDFKLQLNNPLTNQSDQDLMNWQFYSPPKHGIPPSNEYNLPNELWLITRHKKLNFDFYSWKTDFKIVSDDFFNLIKKSNVPKENYQIAKLHITSSKGDPVVNKNYFILRFHAFDDDLFCLNDVPTVQSKVIKNRFLFKKLILKDNKKINQEMFFLSSFCYTKTIIFTKQAKDKCESEKFKGFQIFDDDKFPIIYDDFLSW